MINGMNNHESHRVSHDLLADLICCSGRQAVTAAVPQAASAGAEMLARGGNAFDAALAACLVETVALPMKCGLAGDLVALFKQPGAPVKAVVSIGAAPGALANGGARLSRLGPSSVGVPGAPDGYARLHGMAHLSLDEIAQPAIRAARHGVPWTRIGLGYLAESRELLETWSPGCVYLRGPAPRAGDMLHVPEMAGLIESFCAEGAALFDGALGRNVVDHVGRLGGFLAMSDFRHRPSRLCAPVAWEDGDGRKLYATPDPTQGPLLLEALADAGTALDAEPATDRQIDAVARACQRAKARGREARDDGTSVVAAADNDGNIVVVVHSNSFPRFGSGVVLENGLVLNNRPGRGFDLEVPAGARNAARAGAVPPTTLHAWALEDADGITFGATPGGVNQLPWNLQMLQGLLQGKTLAQTMLQPRWAVNDAGQYTFEEGMNRTACAEGATLDYLGLRSAHQAIRRSNDGWLEACADARVGARALTLF